MRLSLEQIISFETDGYLVVEDALTASDVDPVIAELSEMIDERARRLKTEGKIECLCDGEAFETRFASLYRQSAAIGQGFDIMHLRGPAMFRFLKNDNLLDVVECLLGSEIACNPIQHIRAKLPDELLPGRDYFQTVPWHQDAGVTMPEADGSKIVTFWIPLVDATPETGCMEVMPGAFRLGYLKHQAEGGTTIVPDLLPKVAPRPVPCPKGGMVIMNQFTPHRGTANRSGIIRWSIDLRYHKTGAASGRPFHPSFVVRSRSNPAGVLDDYTRWSEMWAEALATSKGMAIHRV